VNAPTPDEAAAAMSAPTPDEAAAAMSSPTPEEAAAALRTVRQGKERVITSALGARWMWVGGGLVVFVYCSAIDLFPAVSTWLLWPVLAVLLVVETALHTRMGSALLGRPVSVSGRSLPLTLGWRVLRVAPLVGLGVVALVISVTHLPHGGIYFGAIAGGYIAFVSPRFQVWLLRRHGKVA
jgi:hypothetical protein